MTATLPASAWCTGGGLWAAPEGPRATARGRRRRGPAGGADRRAAHRPPRAGIAAVIGYPHGIFGGFAGPKTMLPGCLNSPGFSRYDRPSPPRDPRIAVRFRQNWTDRIRNGAGRPRHRA